MRRPRGAAGDRRLPGCNGPGIEDRDRFSLLSVRSSRANGVTAPGVAVRAGQVTMFMRSVFGYLGNIPFLNRKRQEPAGYESAEGPIYNDLHSELASVLRETRKRAGLTLHDVARDLRIQHRHLEAIERADFKALPGQVYAYGYIRSYAGYLGLDARQAIQMFKAQAFALAHRPRMQFLEPPAEGRLPGGAIILVASALVVLIYSGWYYTSISDPAVIEPVAQVEEERPDEPEVAVADAGTAVAAVPPEVSDAEPGSEYSLEGPGMTGEGDVSIVAAAPEPDEGTAVDGRAPREPLKPVLRAAVRGTLEPARKPSEQQVTRRSYGSLAPARVEIVASTESWVHVMEFDTTLVMSRVLRAGETYRVPARPGLTLSTTNAGGISLVVDGRRLPSLGAPGDVVRDIDLDPDTLSDRLD